MRECLVAAALAAGIVLAATGPFARWLRAGRLRREVRIDTPESHQAKQGTPSMGGVVLTLAVAAACLAASPTVSCLVLTLATVAFAGLGFLDDFVKATARPGFGIKARHKFSVQVGLSGGAVYAVAWAFELPPALHWPPTFAAVPLGWAFVPAAVFFVVAVTNATNIVDGLDGLAAGVLFLCFGALTVISAVEGLTPVAAFSGAAAGACLAFLWFNRHPARIWMGDTGSMALGAGLALTALASGKELLLPLLALVLVVDGVSVILQVLAFKTTGKRLFRIAPIHHALELRGWPETRVVTGAWLLTGVGALGSAAVWLSGR